MSVGRIAGVGIAVLVALSLTGCGGSSKDAGTKGGTGAKDTDTAVTAPATSDEATDKDADAGAGTAASYAIGDCLTGVLDAGAYGEVSTVGCDAEHEGEVYSLRTATLTDFSYADIIAEAQSVCRDDFAAYVGIDYTQSQLFYTFLAPSEQTWNDGDRAIVCLVKTLEDSSTGSLKGAAR